MEFRVFVSSKRIIGLCQRDSTAIYPFLSENETYNLAGVGLMTLKEIIIHQIKDLHTKITEVDVLPDQYTLDVYIDKKPKYKCRLIDVNPWPNEESEFNRTSSLLFEQNHL